MLATDTFSHNGANGNSPGDRMTAAGYAFGGSWSWGENISIRWGGTQAITPAAIDAFHDGLFRSPGHRTNIENAGFREIGIGVQAGEYQGSNGLTATEDFARSGTSAVGVAFDDRDGDMPTTRGRGWAASRWISAAASGQLWHLATWDAGGWQQPLAAGTYSVTFSGGGLAAPVVRTAVLGTANLKLNLDIDVGPGTDGAAWDGGGGDVDRHRRGGADPGSRRG